MEDIVKKISFNSNVRVSFLHVGYTMAYENMLQ